MLNHLDSLLRDLFLAQINQLTDEGQVRFQPPDEDWRIYVAGLSVGGQPANALNVYLFDVRENRKLRTNERTQSVSSGLVSRDPAPARADFHYLISAWSPATATPAIEPTLDEHALLYQALAVLMQNAPLNASRIYPPGSAALNAVPALIRDNDLPTQVAPVEGLTKLAEFWGTMGQNSRWRPAIYLVVTLPVALLTEIAGPMVTTRIVEYHVLGGQGGAEVLIQIGGHVLDTTQPLPDGSPAPVAGAWVRLETPGGVPLQITESSSLGRFTFGQLRAGSYRLRARAAGQGETTRDVDVPSPGGEYDLRFT